MKGSLLGSVRELQFILCPEALVDSFEVQMQSVLVDRSSIDVDGFQHYFVQACGVLVGATGRSLALKFLDLQLEMNIEAAWLVSKSKNFLAWVPALYAAVCPTARSFEHLPAK